MQANAKRAGGNTQIGGNRGPVLFAKINPAHKFGLIGAHCRQKRMQTGAQIRVQTIILLCGLLDL